MIPLSEFGGIRSDMEKILREIPSLFGALRPIIMDTKNTTRDQEDLQWPGELWRSTTEAGALQRVNCAGGRA